MGQTIVNIGCWLIRASSRLGPCYRVADVNLNQLELNLILFPYLASKLPVAVITKKHSRLDQGEEGQGIFFQLVICDPVCLDIHSRHLLSETPKGPLQKFETVKVRDIRLVWKMQGTYKIL